MASTTRYIRNNRPNQFNVRVEGLSLKLGRRGTREDTLAVPASVFSSPAFRRNISRGHIEEITEEEFMVLTERDDDVETLHNENIRKRTTEVRYELDERPNKGHIIKEFTDKATPDEKRKAREWMSPALQYVNPPATTADEVAELKSQSGLYDDELEDDMEEELPPPPPPKPKRAPAKKPATRRRPTKTS